MSYQWLFFDADGTLFDYERAETSALRKSFQQFGVSSSPAYLAAYQHINSGLWRDLEKGLILPEALKVRRFELLFDQLHLPLSAEAFSTVYLEQLASCSELVQGAEELLRRLHQRYQIAILTNGLKNVQRPRLANSAIRDYVDALVISEEVGAAKPEATFFEAAFAATHQPFMSEVLMIGDSLSSDIQGAIRYGLDTCWYNPSGLPRPPEVPINYVIRDLHELGVILGI